MKKVTIILGLMISHLGFSQVTDTGDKVGVGLTNPETKLHIKSDGLSLRLSPSNYTSLGSEIGMDFRHLTHNGAFRAGGSIKSISVNSYTGGVGSSYDSHLVLYSAGDGVLVEGLRISDLGNIGVGTPTPSKKLDVRSTGIGADWISGTFGSTTTSDRIVMGNHGGAASIGAHNSSLNAWADLSINFGGGNVGIGTKNPSEKLDVNGTVMSNYLRINASSSTEGGEIKLDGPTSFNDWRIDNWSGDFRLHHSGTEYLRLKSNGYLGIGTASPDAKLAVNGNIHTKEVKVDLIGWSDFVFEDSYKLPTLKEVEQHIKENGHLKDIPSEEEVKKDGIYLGEMDSKLLQKIEELTLYTIEQQKQIETQYSKIEKLEKENNELQSLSKRLSDIEKMINNKKQ